MVKLSIYIKLLEFTVNEDEVLTRTSVHRIVAAPPQTPPFLDVYTGMVLNVEQCQRKHRW